MTSRQRRLIHRYSIAYRTLEAVVPESVPPQPGSAVTAASSVSAVRNDGDAAPDETLDSEVAA